ncbi:MAG: FtsW/RodA/SpoVE family cell cycle protein, partial [bacterium]
MVGKGGNDWNVRQSKIALGAGQFSGKGFLKGTQSKMNFLPAKETDFIFCTIGEEWGFLGCSLVIGLYIFLMLRILHLSEKHSSKFSKVYGYAIVCVFMMHFI